MQSRCLRALRRTSRSSPSLSSSVRPFSSANDNKKRAPAAGPTPPPPEEPQAPPLTPGEIREGLKNMNIFDSRPSKPIDKKVRAPQDQIPKRDKPRFQEEEDVLVTKMGGRRPRPRFSNLKSEIQEREALASGQKRGSGAADIPRRAASEDPREREEAEMWESRMRADPSSLFPDPRMIHIDDDVQMSWDKVEPYINLRFPGDGGGVALKQKWEKTLDEMEEVEKKTGKTMAEQFTDMSDASLEHVWEDEIPDEKIIMNEIFPLHDQEGHPLQWAERQTVMEEFKKELFEELEYPLVSPVYVSDEKRKKYDEVEDYHMLQKFLQRADHTFFNEPDEEAYWSSHDPPERVVEKEETFKLDEVKETKKTFPIYQYTCLLWQKSRTRKYETGFKQKHTCMIVGGNGKGVGGFGIGKAQTAEEAFEAAILNIEKNLFFVPLHEGRTLPQPVVGQMNETKVIVTPMRKGAGLKGADLIHEVFRCWGITDCNVKIIGGKNRYSLMYALWDALARQTTLRSEAMRRGVNYHRAFVGGQDGDFENPKRWKYPSREWVKERQFRLERVFAHAWRIYEERSDDINKEIAAETAKQAVRRLTTRNDHYITPISNKKPYHRSQ